MNSNNLDKKLVKRSYELISKKYSTENGKKFILHIISAFIVNGCDDITIDNCNSVDELECCITRAKISPKGSPIPSENSYYGVKSDKSDRILSLESLEALKKFIEYRSLSGDDVISKIMSYSKKSTNSEVTNKSRKITKNKKIKESKASYECIEVLPKP